MDTNAKDVLELPGPHKKTDLSKETEDENVAGGYLCLFKEGRESVFPK
jgi:hypothetical protein